MQATNRLLTFYATQKLVPYDEVEELRNDSWNDGFRDGYRNGMTSWCVVAGLAFLVGVLVAAVVL